MLKATAEYFLSNGYENYNVCFMSRNLIKIKFQLFNKSGNILLINLISLCNDNSYFYQIKNEYIYFLSRLLICCKNFKHKYFINIFIEMWGKWCANSSVKSYYTISWHVTVPLLCTEIVWYLPLKLSVTEDGLTAEIGLTITILLLNWHIYIHIICISFTLLLIITYFHCFDGNKIIYYIYSLHLNSLVSQVKITCIVRGHILTKYIFLYI